jgi:hypothetical protein
MSELDMNEGENGTQDNTNAADNNVRDTQKVVLATCPGRCTDDKVLLALEFMHRII